MSVFKKFFKSLITDGNKINESNIILIFLTFMVGVIDIVGLVKGIDMPVIMVIGEHLLVIFLLSKTEHSRLDANKVVEVAGEVLKK